MRTIFRRRGQGLVLAALALIVGLPERAQAQQTGLFPLAPIRRQRVPCDQQDPTYKIHKYQYFGYHPTCWQPFPAGWGCPSPEAPNKAEAFRKQPFDAGTGLNEPGPGNMGPMPGEPDLTRPEVPPIPGGRPSPFETQPGAGGPVMFRHHQEAIQSFRRLSTSRRKTPHRVPLPMLREPDENARRLLRQGQIPRN